jgi:hypothetical protein
MVLGLSLAVRGFFFFGYPACVAVASADVRANVPEDFGAVCFLPLAFSRTSSESGLVITGLIESLSGDNSNQFVC